MEGGVVRGERKEKRETENLVNGSNGEMGKNAERREAGKRSVKKGECVGKRLGLKEWESQDGIKYQWKGCKEGRSRRQSERGRKGRG